VGRDELDRTVSRSDLAVAVHALVPGAADQYRPKRGPGGDGNHGGAYPAADPGAVYSRDTQHSTSGADPPVDLASLLRLAPEASRARGGKWQGTSVGLRPTQSPSLAEHRRRTQPRGLLIPRRASAHSGWWSRPGPTLSDPRLTCPPEQEGTRLRRVPSAAGPMALFHATAASQDWGSSWLIYFQAPSPA
jgi:hypothetical protein